MDIKNVAVVGAGVMGHGIAETIAIAGYEVSLYDHKKENIEKALKKIDKSLKKLESKNIIPSGGCESTKERINTTVDLEKAVSNVDFVIETVPENLDLKHSVFSRLDRYTQDHTILASGTSSLPITEIAKAVDNPKRVVGMHWFNPPVLMKLVEVIYGRETSDETAEQTYQFAKKINKTPIYCKKDVRGFIVTNILKPFYVEPMWMVSRGEATIKEIDSAMVHQRNYPMGPFQLADLTGIDIVHDVIKEAGEPIPPIMKEKVEKRELGQKTDKGFYNYKEGQKPDYKEKDGEEFDPLLIEALMINEAAKLVEIDAATPKDIDTGMKLGARFPVGPCKKADTIGLDKILEKLKKQHKKYRENRYKPTDWLKNKINSGDIDKKTETVFYNHKNPNQKTYHTIETHHNEKQGVVKITLNRPEKHNAINEKMMNEIPNYIETLNPDTVKCIVIEGKGTKAFSTGAEIEMLQKWTTQKAGQTKKIFQTIENYPSPVIAKIDGYALGAGLELALSCDLRYATKKTQLGFPEINIGIFPGGGGTQKLPRYIGETRAKQMILLGEKIDAETAEKWGLINKAVPNKKLDQTVEKTVKKLIKGPPIAIKLAKKTINEGRDHTLQNAIKHESKQFKKLFNTKDIEEGISAFKEKREPNFKGK
ncbi:3-hydroxyacyl-CoA dehydrogenase some fused to Enoyl-CoA hydratase [Methanonatronarchaeum thermophilum]|uniref:3-hydroxyacyl-CoA dehydrogenase some fused to Enoyl-CoA hydratase n=1 Tax=Methanonatronarchaeum thermophilum TaxID=1927129 RepID=A0A1Y3G9Y7_9EURY|nr:3-hydroxyacyl-CoA dehydrogenase/enoyl-CoA hydratase family protein [Methanonatronarchaeum thermophilum]OUJ18238.1 3-hydroxyacyl-CoA dehydrogenase some fused to Enoyl-CoA hydratase [Methanonatronarchaeum thermophilum]